MLARLARQLPADGYNFEPKWDGFRCLCFRAGADVDLRSRHDRPLVRYFPEIGEALARLPARSFTLDGELMVVAHTGFDFAALMGRLHPAASRVARLRVEAPAILVCFDLLGLEGEDLREHPFAERRRRLEELLAGAAQPLFMTPMTDDRGIAEDWLERFGGGGVDGVVAKHDELPYEAGRRAMIKVKRERTADVVVAGLRSTMAGEGMVASLLLGLYDEQGRLQHVGVASAFPAAQRRELYRQLLPVAVALADHPWRDGFLIEGGSLGRLKGSAGRWTPDMSHDWLPLAPERVCEVAYDQVDGHRFRHPARFRRWRPDRTPTSCMVDQLVEAKPDLQRLLAQSPRPR